MNAAALLVAGALSATGATHAGVDGCLTEALAWPGNNITVHMDLYRQAPRRFIGHCDIDDELGNHETYRFDVTKRKRADGRWQVLLHERSGTHV